MEIRRPRAHAVWTAPADGEAGAPERRIIHVVHAGMPGGGTARVGLKPARAYRKCGSRDETDWIRDLRIHAWDGAAWGLAFEARDLPGPGSGEDGLTWLDADLTSCRGVLVEVRRSWIDDWWPSWNLVSRGVVVEAPAPDAAPRRPPASPLPASVDLTGLRAGLEARRVGGEIRYRSRTLEVGFRLGRPAMSFLAFEPDGLPDRATDLLRHPNLYEGDGGDWIPNEPLFGQFALGPQLVTPDGLSHIGQFAALQAGDVTVRGATITYRIDLPGLDGSLELHWTVDANRLQLDAHRHLDHSLRTVESSVWHVGLDCRVSPPALLGRPTRHGETGLCRPPATLHVPGHGSLAIEATGDIGVRFEAARPVMTSALEIKLGEHPGELGDHELPAGDADGSISLTVTHGPVPALVDDAPAPVRAGIRRAWLTGMTYRLDTTALSNNGASIHVPASLETWAPEAAAIGRINTTTTALDLVRDTVDRYLDGAPGYGAGRTSFHPGLLQEEYVATDAAVLLGIAHCIAAAPDEAWLEARGEAIRGLMRRAAALDVDDDGLIESTLRRGVTGSGEWSTNLCDNVSFGWKDAYANAILFDALTRLQACLPGERWASVRGDLGSWANRLGAAYMPAFWNDANGWVAGWRSVDGELHDAGFLWVNGAAVNAGLVPDDLAWTAIDRLWTELVDGGFDDFHLGLPLNVRSIARGDMIERFEGMPWGFVMPHGFNTNGAASLAGARHFLAALRRVGKVAEADRVLDGIFAALADGSAFGGCTSGVDLRTWDGTPCGYEGMLTDQFGVLTVALERYGAGSRGSSSSMA
ncbi:MAG TPA: hypothetical protein VL749_08710 [Patescibacteria group bacterium]|nr:hypothetical protein [Patescibacteria group bacterium]